MSQHDYVIDNQDGASFRADINAAFAAGVSLNSGLTEPATPYAFMFWQDTTAGVLKQRNAANTAWVKIQDLVLSLSTAQATTSGTSKDFTIPAWAKRITVLFNGVSLSGTAHLQVQIGKTTPEATGYNSTNVATSSATLTTNSATTGFVINSPGAAGVASGALVLANVSGNVWVASGSVKTGTTSMVSVAGDKTTANAPDILRVTSTSTDTFDLGSVNVLFE